MKKKKDDRREEILESFYQDHNEYSVGMQRNFLEQRMNEQRYGVFGNALRNLLLIAVLPGICFAIYLITK